MTALPSTTTPAPASVDALVIHAGALGDSVLLWPLLRAVRASRRTVAFAARAEHARLAARVLGVVPLDVDAPAFTALWLDRPGPLAPSAALPRTHLLITALFDAHDAPPHWLARAVEATGALEILPIGTPSSVSRTAAWTRFEVAARSTIPPLVQPRGPILIHAGAGSAAKRWPMDRCVQLAHGLQARRLDARLIAGHVEAERLSPADRARFLDAGGEFLPDLSTLLDRLRDARALVAADTGPAHLAAQLGLPTLTLFGPTDPHIWSPVGPLARTLAPPTARPMIWLDVDAVDRALHELLTSTDNTPESPRPWS
jgi:hypothetical protein